MTPLDTLREEALACRKCGLCETRTNVVFGVGNPQAKVMLIGEGPGEQEDLTGEPFVGRSGQLMDKMLAYVGLSRNTNVYIANMVKCRPPKNRDPAPDEVCACMEYLHQQIAILRPRIVVCVGRIAAISIIDPKFRVTAQHGQFIHRGEALYMGTFHPAALLRNPHNKPDAMEDLLALRRKMEELALIDPDTPPIV